MNEWLEWWIHDAGPVLTFLSTFVLVPAAVVLNDISILFIGLPAVWASWGIPSLLNSTVTIVRAIHRKKPR